MDSEDWYHVREIKPYNRSFRCEGNMAETLGNNPR